MKYRNKVTGKLCVIVSEVDGLVGFELASGGVAHYLGRSEFHRRFQLVPETEAPTPVSIVSGSVEDFATRLFSLPGFMLRETYKGHPAVTVTFPTEEDANQFHGTLAELSQHRCEEGGDA